MIEIIKDVSSFTKIKFSIKVYNTLLQRNFKKVQILILLLKKKAKI
jgi:hypothetical protein